MSQTKFTLPAFAKINLTLRVLGRRADHYHEIQTVFQTISLHDSLTFEPLTDERFELTCSDLEIPTDESNLVRRAATALRERFRVCRGARVELCKRIPAGGGLGGGSSDAAVALLGLTRLWKIRASKSELADIGAGLGADVPYFFTGGTALGTGTGTIVTPLEDALRRHLVVIAPRVKVSTADAYEALKSPALTKADSPVMLPISRTEPEFSGSLHEVVHNDFERVIFELYPEIESASEALLRLGARRAMLSGSGSSVFGIFDDFVEAEKARDALASEIDWRVFACSTLTRAEYFKELGGLAELL
ncbi:MAG: 4-(cytidine 5'-diphospho)-2-C-methyl-D-erythritol kinase [Pyrinomonadaceae bacterium]